MINLALIDPVVLNIFLILIKPAFNTKIDVRMMEGYDIDTLKFQLKHIFYLISLQY